MIVEQGDWRAAISAAQLMARPLRAPILFSNGGELPAASAEALEELAPTGAQEAGGAQVIRIGNAREAGEPASVKDVDGLELGLARPGDRPLQTDAAGSPTDAVLVAPADSPEFAMPAAGWAAKSGEPGAVDAQGLAAGRDPRGDRGAPRAADLRARAARGDLRERGHGARQARQDEADLRAPTR